MDISPADKTDTFIIKKRDMRFGIISESRASNLSLLLVNSPPWVSDRLWVVHVSKALNYDD